MAGYTSGRSSSAIILAGAILAFGVCLEAAGPVSSEAAPAKVTAVRFWSLGEATRVAIEVSSDFRFHSERLSDPDRLFFDIDGARPEMGKGIHTIPVGDSLLKQIRVAETQRGVTRIVLDLGQPADFKASQLSNPGRLIVELRPRAVELRPADRPASDAATLSSVVTGSAVTNVRTLSEPATRITDPALADASTHGSITESRSLPAVAPDLSPPQRTELRKFTPPPPAPPAVVARVEQTPLLLAQPTLAIVTKPRVPSGPPVTLPLSVLHEIPAPIEPPPSRLRVEPVKLAEPANQKAEPAKPVLTESLSAAEALPAKRNATGDRSLTRVLGLKLGRVVLDAGHGGHDAGTHGPSGLYEKDVVLDVTQRLGALLEERLGSEIVYTRSDDSYVALEERTRIANAAKADLFLSIHANSSPLRAAAGVETYYLNFTTSRTALDVAARENATSDRSIYDLQELLEKIALKDKIEESREFAARLQTALYSVSSKGNVAAKNRGIKKAPFVVLIGASMPSVLAEIGFLTNAADESLLRKPEQRQKIAEALYKGIASYAETLSHFTVARRE